MLNSASVLESCMRRFCILIVLAFLACACGQNKTTVPMHPGDLPRWLLKKIIKDAGLSEDQFRSLL